MSKPCLSDCIKKDGHAPGCPNAEAPTAPKCCRGAEYLTARNEMACLDCGKILFKIKMPKPAPAPVDHSEQDLNMVPPERPRSLFDLEVERLKALEAQHNRLCLADLGGDGVWPCGCHHLIVDSHGTRKLLTAADGEVHQECDDHSALRAAVDSLTLDAERSAKTETALRAELAQAKAVRR